MNLAEDIANRILEMRQEGTDLSVLQPAIDRCSQQCFWSRDRRGQMARLSEALAGNTSFQGDLAEAIGWEKPANDSSELTLLAVDASRGKNPITACGYLRERSGLGTLEGAAGPAKYSDAVRKQQRGKKCIRARSWRLSRKASRG